MRVFAELGASFGALVLHTDLPFVSGVLVMGKGGPSAEVSFLVLIFRVEEVAEFLSVR